MKYISKYSLILLSFLVLASCDNVDDEVSAVDEISTETERYHFENEDVVIPIYGSFEHANLQIISPNNQLRPIATDRSISEVTFMRYLPGAGNSESIDIQVVDGTRVVGQGTVEITRVDRSATIASGVSRDYKVDLGPNKFSINLLSDLGHGLASPNLAEARVIPVRRSNGAFAHGALVTTSFNDEGTMDVILDYETYCSGEGFGKQEFVIEMCLEPTTSVGEVWLDPVKNCGTYTTALTAFSY